METNGENVYGIGHEIGTRSAEQTEAQAAEYCAHERQRIELTNQSSVLALRAKIAALTETVEDLEERIRKAMPPGEEASRRRKIIFYWSIAALLLIAGFAFSVVAFEPFRLGWKAWLYCIGIAVVTPFLVDQMLDSWASGTVIKTLRTAGCIAAILSVILLAVVRGDIFAEQITHEAPAVSITSDDSPTSPTPAPEATNTFYDRTLNSLRLMMALLAVAMELGAGLALHEARRWSSVAEDREALRHKLSTVRDEMIEHGQTLWLLESEGAVFEHAFWRDFYRSLLTNAVVGAMRKLAVIVLAIACLGHARLHATDRLDVVILVDLSKSVAAEGHNNTTEFQKNISGVTNILASLPAGSHVSIYGITDDSFGKPYPLLTAELSDDEGYFHERLSEGRRQLVRTWQQRVFKLEPRFSHTDVLGAILMASQAFATKSPERKRMLILFSDMRQSTQLVDLEDPDVLRQQSRNALLQNKGMQPALSGVRVYALGVDANGETVQYWRQLRDAWLAYFEAAGASVNTYSVMRYVPDLGEGANP